MAMQVSQQLVDDLLTIVDFCHEMSHDTGFAGENYPEVADAHDLAHVLTGGDKTHTWNLAFGWAPDDGVFTDAAPDVFRRMDELILRLRKDYP